MYSLKVLPCAQRDLDSLGLALLERVKPVLLALKTQLRPHGAIKLTADDGYRIRVGDYRLLYRIDDKERAVYLYRFKNRKEAYR